MITRRDIHEGIPALRNKVMAPELYNQDEAGAIYDEFNVITTPLTGEEVPSERTHVWGLSSFSQCCVMLSCSTCSVFHALPEAQD